MIKYYNKSSIVSFFCAIGDNPQIFDTINSIRRGIPNSQIAIWHDCCSDEHAKKVEEVVDVYIRSNTNLGVTRALGYAMLYLDYDYLCLVADDYILPDNYWEQIKSFFNDKTVGVVGESLAPNGEKRNDVLQYYIADKHNFPDAPIVFKKEAINDIGSISPAFGVYAHHIMELQDRIYDKGWKIIGVNTGTKHLGHVSIDMIKKNSMEFYEQELKKSDIAWKTSTKRNWWTNKLEGGKENGI